MRNLPENEEEVRRVEDDRGWYNVSQLDPP
jgi:hypothetical protein